MRLPYDYDLQKLLGDAIGGTTTAVTVLPMALAYGVATGLGPIAGMYGAIAVGFLTAACGGTPGPDFLYRRGHGGGDDCGA